MDAATQRQISLFTGLAQKLLHTSMLQIDRTLIPNEYPDRTLMPEIMCRVWDEVMFGGVLFDCSPGNACEIDTSYGVCFSAMQLHDADGFLLLGPYVPEDGSRFSVEQALSQSNASIEERNRFLQYYTELPVLNHEKIYSLLNALSIELYGASLPNYFTPLELSGDRPSPCPVFEEDSLWVQAEVIAARYANENTFFDRLAQGELSEDLFAAVPDLQRVPNRMRNAQNMMIILNTLLRKTIERVKVHPYYIDQISSKWAVRIENAETLSQIDQLKRDMVEDYVRVVRQHSLANYTHNVRAMLNYVQFHLSDPELSLSAIAKKLDVNASYLSQQFNREVGRSLPDYIATLRMEEAKRLLRSGHAPINQVAAAVGYADVNYFSRVFRKQTGVTPTEFRKG
jgi:AraC-like DNA-binding protein